MRPEACIERAIEARGSAELITDEVEADEFEADEVE